MDLLPSITIGSARTGDLVTIDLNDASTTKHPDAQADSFAGRVAKSFLHWLGLYVRARTPLGETPNFPIS